MKLKEIRIYRKTLITMKQNKYKRNLVETGLYLLLSVGFVFNSCTTDEEVLFTGDEYENIYQYIKKEEARYSKFITLAEAGGIDASLSSYNNHLYGDNYTLFLPTNDAVDAFLASSENYGSFDELLTDTSYVKILVRYHLLNSEIESKDFPNGALEAETLTNDYLTVNFGQDDTGEISYKINNLASVTHEDILKNNGVIHEIDHMLSPVAYTAYGWIQSKKQHGFSIFAELLEATGLQDTLNYFEIDELGNKIYQGYTLFAESDELYHEKGITSFSDLVQQISPNETNFGEQSNLLNKFARYHVVIGKVFLDQFSANNYNTYGDYPIAVDVLEEDIVFNRGVAIFDQLIEGEDTTNINYLEIQIPLSNIPTKTGPIHQLNEILYSYRPGLKVVDINFYNEPIISDLMEYTGSFAIPSEDLKYFNLLGPEYLYYTRSSTTINGVQNKDYIRVGGEFEFTYETPSILAGTYQLALRAHRNSSSNAMVQVYIDGEKAGGMIDLTSGSESWSDFVPDFILDNVTFSDNRVHQIKIKTIKPGNLLLDRLILTPVSK